MATDQEFVDYIMDQINTDHEVRSKKMFGEYGLFVNNKIVGLICDNMFFVKPTESGRKFIGKPTEAPPYPGAKNSFLIEDLEDGEWLTELIEISYKELPEPKKKKKKVKKK